MDFVPVQETHTDEDELRTIMSTDNENKPIAAVRKVLE